MWPKKQNSSFNTLMAPPYVIRHIYCCTGETISSGFQIMISFSSSQRFFLYREATDMRKSFNGLCGVVTNELQKPLTTGDVFMFINKRATASSY